MRGLDVRTWVVTAVCALTISGWAVGQDTGDQPGQAPQQPQQPQEQPAPTPIPNVTPQTPPSRPRPGSPPPVHNPQTAQQQEQLRRQGLAVAFERAHGHQIWKTKSALQADLTVTLEGKTVFEGTLWHNIADGRTRVKTKDGVEIGSDGNHIWTLPSSAAVEHATYHARAWPFFVVAPLTLRDPGMELSDHKAIALQGRPSETVHVKLPGPTSGQDFVVYNDTRTQQLRAIVFASPWLSSQGGEAAGGSPAAHTHLVMFSDHTPVENVTFANTWSFYKWTPDRGIQGEPVGEGKLSNVQFITPADGFFDKPADAREITS